LPPRRWAVAGREEGRVKKLVIGCLVIVVLAGIGGAVGTYWVYRKVRGTVAEFAQFQQVPELERQVQNTSAFAPPASGELTASQVERLVKVQASVRANLGASFARMEQRYKALTAKQEATALDLPEILSAYRDLASSYMDAKRAHVDALNAQGFSLEEYRWVKQQAYTALGLAYLDIDVGKIVQAISAGATDVDPARMAGSVGPGGPEANRGLVKPHEKTLMDNVALASFGL
jgi:hypothetical protein